MIKDTFYFEKKYLIREKLYPIVLLITLHKIFIVYGLFFYIKFVVLIHTFINGKIETYNNRKWI